MSKSDINLPFAGRRYWRDHSTVRRTPRQCARGTHRNAPKDRLVVVDYAGEGDRILHKSRVVAVFRAVRPVGEEGQVHAANPRFHGPASSISVVFVRTASVW